MPFPVASVGRRAGRRPSAPGAALIKREATGYGQHVETSLLDALLFLNAAPIFHREGRRPLVTRQRNSPVLRLYDDGRRPRRMHGQPERHRSGGAGCAALLEHRRRRASTTRRAEGLARGSPTASGTGPRCSARSPRPSPPRRPTSGKQALLAERPAAVGQVQHARRVAGAASRPAPTTLVRRNRRSGPLGRASRWSGPPRRIPQADPGERSARHGGTAGSRARSAAYLVVDLSSSFWAGPLVAASRLLGGRSSVPTW